ncbi:hypothetical protein PV403_08055 [Paenibacillus sp. GYB006]|uniref:hypothetical protein n=1 Tax=Paenibacillus sp. GYB006 TaxID=2994394 RepID=UPI002F961ED2
MKNENEVEPMESFSRFMLFTVLISVLSMLLLYILTMIQPYDPFPGYDFRSLTSLITYYLGFLIPVIIIFFISNMIMLLLHDRMKRLSLIWRCMYYLLMGVILSIPFHFLIRPEWFVVYLCSIVPPFIFGWVLEKKWLIQISKNELNKNQKGNR